ncbi:hypothetical protein TTHERM_000010989 (macronuclear) [Tetrahymena thermophila SB210]|uniref:Uncharacterized protein n=1 Tax=Tetrahymena thermophila (strain SB210) TaxID=312017 RepID=W7XLI0_TETTS|nr:hypothetical protein TTHERM_000010989 [Tetrahymena thermophila SB210]EWS76324.1 hypothetical protein TTHERM_000010989 [Tetrahymena thermophila SB210]|eukprot:XP_012651108.1 hypothetical protein TTHERM_000010989 [Tetrahymena thermophila SB210]
MLQKLNLKISFIDYILYQYLNILFALSDLLLSQYLRIIQEIKQKGLIINKRNYGILKSFISNFSFRLSPQSEYKEHKKINKIKFFQCKTILNITTICFIKSCSSSKNTNNEKLVEDILSQNLKLTICIEMITYIRQYHIRQIEQYKYIIKIQVIYFNYKIDIVQYATLQLFNIQNYYFFNDNSEKFNIVNEFNNYFIHHLQFRV